MCNWRTKEAKFECLKCNGRVFFANSSGSCTQMASPASFHSNPDDGSCNESVLKCLDKMRNIANLKESEQFLHEQKDGALFYVTVPVEDSVNTSATHPKAPESRIQAQSRNKKGKKFLRNTRISPDADCFEKFFELGKPFVNCLCQKPQLS
jgi:hypothetical protein